MKWARQALAVIICIASLAWVSRPGQAQGSPAPAPIGASIMPGNNPTNVRMESEVVNYSVASYSFSGGLAYVKAIYQMRNLGDFPEQMYVRFPLYAYNVSFQSPDRPPEAITFPPLQNVSAQIDEAPASLSFTEAKVLQPHGEKNELKEASVPVWAAFPVTFPPGKVVKITVEYIQQSFAGYYGTYLYSSYSHILYSGAGWKGTIGSADINIILPMPADDISVQYAEPKSATISGYKINWHFTDFKPEPGEEDGSVVASIIDPGSYLEMLDAQKAVDAAPRDGDAWGRLANAYKALGWRPVELGGGFRWDDTGKALFQKSVAAYQKAIALLPSDYRWHYEFADLMCYNAQYKYSGAGTTISIEELAQEVETCHSELNQAQALNPDDANTAYWIKWYADLTDPRTPTATETSIHSDVTLPPTYTLAPPPVVKSTTPVPAATLTPQPTATPTPAPEIPGPSSGGWIAGIGIVAIIVFVLGAILLGRTKSKT